MTGVQTCALPIYPGEDAGLPVCIDVPGLNRAASQERFWPSCVGRCEGPLHSYVCMPFGLPSVASAYQRDLRRVPTAQEVRYHAVVEEMETIFKEPPEPQSLPRLRAPAAHEESFLQRTSSAAPTLLRLQNQVTSSKLVKLGAPLGLHHSQVVWVRPYGMYPICLCI